MTGRRSTVLVVDDDDGGRYLKTHLLLKAGYAVSEAASGQAALDHCNNTAPEMVLLDTRLPDVHGFDICHEIKAAHPDIIVLQTSAAITSAQERALALDGGADAFLIEPIEPEELLAIVRALLRMRGAEQALRRLNDTLEELVVERTQELRDTYQRLETEIAGRRQAEEALWHTQKLEAVGQLTGGIAHDFNNLLMVIVGSIEMIRKTLQEQRVAPPGKLLRLLRTAETATDRGTELTQQLLAFARRGALRSEISRGGRDHPGAGAAARARTWGERRATFDGAARPMGMPDRPGAGSNSAILNLAVNARDAMPAGGELNVTVGNATIAPGAAGNPPGVPPGSYISIRVADTGRGMEADIAAHVFEPFFTTKDVGKGTGLGLSQVYGFVRQSDGHIVLDTKPGAGTAFTLYLPRCEQADPAASITDEFLLAPSRQAPRRCLSSRSTRGAGTRCRGDQRPGIPRDHGWERTCRAGDPAPRAACRPAVQRHRAARRHGRVRAGAQGAPDPGRVEGADEHRGTPTHGPSAPAAAQCVGAAKAIPAGGTGRSGALRAGPAMSVTTADALIVESPARLAVGLEAFVGRPAAVAVLLVISVFIFVAVFAPLITPGTDPIATSWLAIRKAPSWAHWMGTDELGRDVLSRVIFGARASMLAGVVSVLIAGALGVPAGLLAGFSRGRDRCDAQPAGGCHAGLPVPDIGDRSGGVPGSGPDQRDDRDRGQHGPAFHARGAGVDHGCGES